MSYSCIVTSDRGALALWSESLLEEGQCVLENPTAQDGDTGTKKSLNLLQEDIMEMITAL